MRPVSQPPEIIRQDLRNIDYVDIEDESVIDIPWSDLQKELRLIRDDPAAETIFETENWIAISVDSPVSDVVHQQAGVRDEELRRALSYCHTLAMTERMNYSHAGRPERDSFIIPA